MIDSTAITQIVPSLVAIAIVFFLTPLTSHFVTESLIPRYRDDNTLTCTDEVESDLKAYAKFSSHLVGTLSGAVATLAGLILLSQLGAADWGRWFGTTASIGYLCLTIGVLIGYVPFYLHPGDYNGQAKWLLYPAGSVRPIFWFEVLTVVLNIVAVVAGIA